MAYFGILTILGKFLSENVALTDLHAGWVYSLFTGGITAAMLILGGVTDKIGVRRTLLLSLALMVVGRITLACSGTFFAHGQGAASPMFFTVLAGLLVIVVGYGMYQPAAYAGVKQFTNQKTSAMGFAMIYALMNLGAFVSGVISPPIRRASGMEGVFWIYVLITIAALLSILFILTRKTAQEAQDRVKKEDATFNADNTEQDKATPPEPERTEDDSAPAVPPRRLWEPATLGLAATFVLCSAGLIYLTITQPAPLLQQPFDSYAESLAQVAEDLNPETAADPQPGPASDLAEITQALAMPPGEQPAVDPSAFPIAQTLIASGARLLPKFSHPNLLSRPLTLDQGTADRAQDPLRAHALRVMVLAYGLVGPVDDGVVRNIATRLGHDGQTNSPLTPQQELDLVSLAGQNPQALLTGLASSCDAAQNALNPLLPEPWAQAMALGLNPQRRLAEDLVGQTPSQLGAVGRQLLTEIFLASSLHASAMADLAQRSVPQEATEESVGLMASIMAVIGGAAPAERQSVHGYDFAAAWLVSQAELSAEFGRIMPTAAESSLPTRMAKWSQRYGVMGLLALLSLVGLIWRIMRLRPEHPFHNSRFTFFIFILIPVQTLFAHNWLTLPYYINRAFGGTTVGENFEFFSNINPILIFVLTPLVAALTLRANVYRMMIWGTMVMALPTFLLVLPPHPALLIAYILLMSVGEAMWQPRFLQLIADIAPEGKVGIYMGIGQLPWFLTKVLTGLYSGAMLQEFCPRVGPQDNEMLWLFHALVAMASPVALIMARGWIGSRIEEKHT